MAFLKAIRKLGQNSLTSIQRFWLFTHAILGIAIIAGTALVSAIYVPLQPLAVLTATLGSCVGMVLLYSAYHKLLELGGGKKQNQTEKLEALEEKLKASELSNVNLELEKARLERMKINVSTIAPMLKLGLASIGLSTTDFMRKVHFDGEARKGWIVKDDVKYRHEYLGVVQRTYTAQLGINLDKLRFRIERGTVIVSGMHSEFQGCTNEETNWLLQEMRLAEEVNGRVKSIEIQYNDKRIQESMIEQEKVLTQRINSGMEFKNLEKMIHNMAKQFISLVLSPLGMDMEFEDNPGIGQSLGDFIHQHNSKVDDQLNALDEGVGK